MMRLSSSDLVPMQLATIDKGILWSRTMLSRAVDRDDLFQGSPNPRVIKGFIENESSALFIIAPFLNPTRAFIADYGQETPNAAALPP